MPSYVFPTIIVFFILPKGRMLQDRMYSPIGTRTKRALPQNHSTRHTVPSLLM